MWRTTRELFLIPNVKMWGKGKHTQKYCKYDKVKSHHTNDCHQLKKEIEKLIQEGHMRRYVQGPQPRSRSLGQKQI